MVPASGGERWWRARLLSPAADPGHSLLITLTAVPLMFLVVGMVNPIPFALQAAAAALTLLTWTHGWFPTTRAMSRDARLGPARARACEAANLGLLAVDQLGVAVLG
jgi:hypothetical protein